MENYHELFKAINAKKVIVTKKYNKCNECSKPKETEREQQFALCCRCNNRRKKLLINGFRFNIITF